MIINTGDNIIKAINDNRKSIARLKKCMYIIRFTCVNPTLCLFLCDENQANIYSIYL